MLSPAQERQARLDDILSTIDALGGRAYRRALMSAACRQWPVSRKTAEEYCDSLVDAEYCSLDAGAAMVLTARGRKRLTQVDATSMPEAGTSTPSPPSSSEGEAQP